MDALNPGHRSNARQHSQSITAVSSSISLPCLRTRVIMRKAFRPPFKRPLTEEQNWEDMSWQKKLRRCITEEKPRPGDPPKEGRTPLLNLPIPGYDPSGRSNPQEAYFNVLWRRQTNRKHKTWDGDGVIIVGGGSLVLKDLDGSQYAPFVMAMG